MDFPQLVKSAQPPAGAPLFFLISLVVAAFALTIAFKKRKLSRLGSLGLDAFAAASVIAVALAIMVLFSQPKGDAFEMYNTSVTEYMDKTYGLSITKAETWKLLDRKPATVTTADGRVEKVRLTSITDKDPELIAEDLSTIPKLTQK